MATINSKIQNLKTAQELSHQMYALYQARFSDCNRGFTGDVLKDVKIQEANIEEGREWFDRYMGINGRVTKSALKGGDEFEAAVEDAKAYIKAMQA